MADTFYTNAGCTLVALNPFKPVPQLYSPELMREYHAAPQPQKLKPHVFTVGEQTYRNVKSLIEPVNQSIVVSGESGAGKAGEAGRLWGDIIVHFVGVREGNICECWCFSMKLRKGSSVKRRTMVEWTYYYLELDQPEMSKDFWAANDCPLHRSKHTSQKATSQGASCSF
ncbi:hypothetical protein CR201_G0055771 [Pongo abelii]|nr:hypothetical protein CR201_G0055771 [Pongo abelii]